jgi:hypothetical protein
MATTSAATSPFDPPFRCVAPRGRPSREAKEKMMAQNDGGPASCAWCAEAAHIRQGRIMLCAAHYRISSMRSRAKRDGKVLPDRKDIEAMIPSPFVCIGCSREMTWLRDRGASVQVTLQHDRDGSMRLICLGCNTRHAAHPSDTFYDIPSDQKFCPDCTRVLPRTSFAADRSRPIGLKSYCRECSSARFKKWSVRNAA